MLAFKIKYRLFNPVFSSQCRLGPPNVLVRRSRSKSFQPCPYVIPKTQARGAKSKATKKLKELPQGVLEGKQILRDCEDDRPSYPVVVQQAWNNMQRFHDCVVVTRVGSFYEVRVWLRLPQLSGNLLFILAVP